MICKHTSVTGSHMQPILVFRAYGCILVRMIHVVHGTREHIALLGIRRIAPGIVQDPAMNSGRPIIEGTRVFVDRLIGHLEHGMSMSCIRARTTSSTLLRSKSSNVFPPYPSSTFTTTLPLPVHHAALAGWGNSSTTHFGMMFILASCYRCCG